MTTSQVLARRYRDVDIDNLLAHFVETLLDVESELESANDWQWDTIVRDACRTRKHAIELSDAESVGDDTAYPGLGTVPFTRPSGPK